jgi:hypothetical protein
MSFVDLMQNDIWSSTDIDNKVQALIRSKYSEQDELKASRLARNTTDDNADDTLFIVNLDAWISSCIDEGRNARSDMQLLLQVFEIEKAAARLKQPEVQPELDEEGTVINQQQIDDDVKSREEAQVVIDTASEESLELYLQRNPVVEEVQAEVEVVE